MKMKTRYNNYIKPLFALLALLMTACTSDVTTDDGQQPLPEGMGSITVTVCTPENNPALTRAVNETSPCEAPEHDWEKLNTCHVLICKASDYKVVQIMDFTSYINTNTTSSDTNEYPYRQSYTKTSEPLTSGNYVLFATGNDIDFRYAVGDVVDLDRTEKFSTDFGTLKRIPMTGKLIDADTKAVKTIKVENGVNKDVGTITLWRVVGKMQFTFTNATATDIKVYGVEVEPINMASDDGPGVYLFSHDYLESLDNLQPGNSTATQDGLTLPEGARDDVGTVKYENKNAETGNLIPLITLAPNGTNEDSPVYFYVNETDATFTATENQLSVRVKIQRKKPGDGDEWYAQEIRYGLTTPHDGTTSGTYGGSNGGFNVIRRNDWIHIPITFRDWQFRIEALPFVPIGGYPAKTLSNDALEATCSTGVRIIIQPFAQKNNDGVWRNFSDPEVEFVSIHWKNSDTGADPAGSGKIIEEAFVYDPVTKCIVGTLNNNLGAGTYKTTLTISVKLGPTGSQAEYTFTCNIILKK